MLDQEQTRKLLTLVDPKTPIRWVHPLQRKGDIAGAMIWHILPMTETRYRTIDGRYASTRMLPDGSIAQSSEFNWAMLREGIVRVDNVLLPGGSTPVDLRTPEEINKLLDCIPFEMLRPVYTALQSFALLSAGDVKNFDGSGDSDGSSNTPKASLDGTAEPNSIGDVLSPSLQGSSVASPTEGRLS